MSWQQFLPFLLVIGLTTWLVKMFPMVLLRRKIHNPYFRAFMRYMPYAVLGAMTVPEGIFATGNVWTAVAGLLVALLLALRKAGLMTVALCAVAAVYVMELLL